MILIAELINHFVNGIVNMATVKKTVKKAQDGKKLLTPARTRQVADSLDYEARMKNAAGVKSVMDEPKSDKAYKLAKALYSDADANTANAKRYRKLADQAEAKSKAGKSKMKSGGMLKRADGSYSKRGLWDNIRANKGSGKKPTAAMLKQEKKIKAKGK